MDRKQAARRNGALSHGPATAAGKSASSQNAIKHGLTSHKMFVLQNEHPEAWAEMFSACVEAFRPNGALELKLVEEIAGAKWRLRRLWYIETGLFDLEMDRQAEAFAAQYEVADESIRQALAFKSLADESRSLSLLSRYETRLQRAYDRAVQALKDLRAQPAADEPTHSQNGGHETVPNEPVTRDERVVPIRKAWGQLPISPADVLRDLALPVCPPQDNNHEPCANLETTHANRAPEIPEAHS